MHSTAILPPETISANKKNGEAIASQKAASNTNSHRQSPSGR